MKQLPLKEASKDQRLSEKLCRSARADPQLSFGFCPVDSSIKTGRSAGVAIPQADRAYQNHFVPAVARNLLAATPPSDSKPPRQKYPEKKIDGMDYYEFCELIRSNSL